MSIFALLLAFTGALLAAGGALAFYTSQASLGSPVWPLPGLVLLDWAITGLSGFLGVYFSSRQPSAEDWRKWAWIASGALVPLVVLGALSIGLYVLASLLCLLAATILVTLSKNANWPAHLGLFLLGAVLNLGLLSLFILLGNPAGIA